ncbi:MAG TPA: class F sortase [Chloroflexota bacterium]
MQKTSYFFALFSFFTAGLAILSPYISIHGSSSAAAQAEGAATSSSVVATVPAVRESVPLAPLAVVASPARTLPASGEVVPAAPTELSIPTIGLDANVIPMSTNEKGEMSVPSGTTSDIGWYKDGVIPGDTGSAVMDAHVFAGFSKLHELAKGDDVYVTDANGNHLHFVVVSTELYALSQLSPDMLFQDTDGRHLNLITCAGSLTPDHSTYDHRLIVYTELAS